MRKVVTLVASALILLGCYVIAFGVPASVRDIVGLDADGGIETGTPAGGQERGGGPGGRNGPNVTTVVLASLEMLPYKDILRAIGSADAIRSADVIATVSGEVTEINLAANRYVSAGDVLVQLDARTEMLNLEIAQTEFEQARDTVQRYERLQATGNSTVTDVTLRETQVAQSLAEANVGLAQIALDDRTIRAPISGKLGLSDLEIGDVLSANKVVTTIDDSKAVLVAFELPERSVGLLAKKQGILATTPSFSGRTFEGEIVSFDSRIDSVTRSVTVKARIENPDGLLWPGMTFSVRIIQESDPLPVLASTAITWSLSGSSIWIDKAGSAEQVAVTILFRQDDQVWVEADIVPGTLVVTEGAQKLRIGSRIQAANATGQSADPGENTPVRDTDAPKIGQADLPRNSVTENPT